MLYKLNLSAVPVSLVGLVGSFTLSSSRFFGFFWEQAGFIWKQSRQEEQPPRAHSPRRTCPRQSLLARTASWGRHGVTSSSSAPAHQHQPALTCGNPAPSIAQTLLQWQLHWAGSSSFPVYCFVYRLHHSAMEKFKCFVTFHWEDTIKLKCLYHSAI